LAGRHGKGGDMVKNKQDELIRAYATLKSLRNNIAGMTDVKETYVNAFHTVLIRLQDIGINTSEFWIPYSEINPRTASINTLTGETRYTEERYVDKSFILTKLDAILGYFEIITSEKPKRIGFIKSDE